MMYLIILGYIYQTQIYEAPNTTQPSFYSAITFILIIIGVLCLRPNKGIVELITSERIGGAFGYKILLSIVIIPVIIGGLRLLGELGGLYDLRFGAALMTFAITTLLFIITLESAISIDNMDIKRKRAEEKLKTAHDHLEKQVKERTTELEDAYKLLKTSENNFRTLTENSVDIIARYDTDFRIIYINKGIGSIGLSREELIGKTIDELGVKKDTVNLWFQSFEKALATAEIQIIEFSLPDVEGLKVFNSYIIPEITNGKIKSLLVVTRDITHRNQVENALKETILELKRSNNDLERFAYVSSHDLQEPLRTIASFTQLLERRYKGQLDDDADEFMDYIVEAAVRMKAQINALLEYSRVSTKGKEFELVDTTAILSKTIKSLSTSLRDSCAEITVDELPNVMGDSDQLQKVFQNLISNAIKFRKNEQSLKIHISAYKDKDEKEYVFSVQDNGIGIEKQYMERIFVIFQRLHTRNVYKGTGIGLAVVKRVIDGHGGRVWVESEFGVGSTFYFTIPIRSENKI
ncbi:sensor histidine kinase [Methanobacterium sp. ACI-7]|uniref:sensor histidine kinase n=1 Tax=unclassified Methanobacterium TaxID=2627676 RepID=UPI0039C1B980